MQWSGEAGAGFSANPSAEAWLPLHPDWKRVNAADQTNAGDSLFSLFRNLISLRKKSRALHSGTFSLFDTGNGSVLSYRRESRDGKESLLVLVNFVSRSVEASLPPGSWESLFSTREHRLADSEARACLEERIILRPLEGIILNLCR
jgi:glycosidase